MLPRTVSRLSRAALQSGTRVANVSKRGLSTSTPEFASSAKSSNKGKIVALGAVLGGLLLATQYKKYNTAYAQDNVQEVAVLAKQAQPCVVSGMHPQGAFVTIRLSKSANLKEVAKAAASLQRIVEDLSPDAKPGEIAPILATIGFSEGIWKQVNPSSSLPKDLTPFQTKKGANGDMPSTGGDILLHVKAETQSLCYETVQVFVDALPPNAVEKVEDWYGFQFQEGRDLSGFLDGTENPADLAERVNAAIITDSDPQHQYGSYAIHQRWVHQLRPFHGLAIDLQEQVIGRTKVDSVELEQKLNPLTSHVSRMRVNGKKVPIVRQSMPFGTVGGEHGLLFLAYSNSPAKFDLLLDRMVGTHKAADGSHSDAIMTFSKAVADYLKLPVRTLVHLHARVLLVIAQLSYAALGLAARHPRQH